MVLIRDNVPKGWHKEIHIRHIMADGTILEDISDYELDIDKVPRVVLRIVGDMLRREPTPPPV